MVLFEQTVYQYISQYMRAQILWKHHKIPWLPLVHLDAGPWVKPEQVKGSTVEQFIAAAQDRTRNALQTSLLAGFNAWKEQLRADEVAFESDKILYPDWFENIAWSDNIYRAFEVLACLFSAFCFSTSKLRCERETAKRRTLLIRQLEDTHWSSLQNENHSTLFLFKR